MVTTINSKCYVILNTNNEKQTNKNILGDFSKHFLGCYRFQDITALHVITHPGWMMNIDISKLDNVLLPISHQVIM